MIAAAAAGHPIWHFAVVAAAAAAVYAYLEIRDRLTQRRSRTFIRQVRSGSALLAITELGAAVVHAKVAPEHFREANIFGLFFVSAAIAQAVWAASVFRAASRPLLIIGAAGNATIILLWLVSRTTGLPAGPEPWVAEPISVLDALASALEAAVVAIIIVHFHARIRRTGDGAPVPAKADPPGTTTHNCFHLIDT